MEQLDFEKFNRDVKRITEALAWSKKTAQAFLIRLGTHTADGKLTKEYGG